MRSKKENSVRLPGPWSTLRLCLPGRQITTCRGVQLPPLTFSMYVPYGSPSFSKDFVAHCKKSLRELLSGPAESELANVPFPLAPFCP